MQQEDFLNDKAVAVIAAKQRKDEQEEQGHEECCNKIPYMICQCHGVKIKCESLMEAEQRARIHMEESKGHEVVWRFE